MTDESINRYYKNDFHAIKRANGDLEFQYAQQLSQSAAIYDFAEPHLSPSTKVLDFGCGTGAKTSSFCEAGLDVFGHDANPDYVTFAESKGLKRHEEGGRYGFVLLSHVIEHINQPLAFLNSARADLLEPNGLLYIEVPALDTVRARNPETHLLGDLHIAHKFYFAANSLHSLLSAAGFKQVAQTGDRFLFTPGKEDPKHKQGLEDTERLLADARKQRWSQQVRVLSLLARDWVNARLR